VKLEEVRELLPVYVLDGLPPEECRQVDTALANYPELLPELKALREVAADLSQANHLTPPLRLKHKVFSRIREKAQKPIVVLPVSPNSIDWSRIAAPVAAAAAVLLLVWGGFRVYPWLEWFQASRNPQAALETLVGENKQPVGRAIFLPGGRTLVWAKLPPPPSGKTYQLWGVAGRDHIGLNTYQGGLIAFDMPKGYTTVHITEEKQGGSKDPTELRALPENEN
jgi:hypothetical protein